MKTNMTSWVIPGVLSALLLAACGGGGGGTSSGGTDTTTPSTPSFTITAVDAQTASVQVVNKSTTDAVTGVQVLVSTLKSEQSPQTSDEVDPATVKVRDVLLYSSSDALNAFPDIAANAVGTFSLKNVNFAAASSDTSASASATVCSGDADTALGTVRLEVFSQGSQLLEKDVPVCAMQGTTYSVSL